MNLVAFFKECSDAHMYTYYHLQTHKHIIMHKAELWVGDFIPTYCHDVVLLIGRVVLTQIL